MNHSELIHALLFTSGHAWKFSELADSLGITLKEVLAATGELAEKLHDQPVTTIIHNDSIALVTRPELMEFLQAREDEELGKEFSKGALETLALIAYRGPIAKSDIDYIRGVNSQFMIRNLFLRGMIEKASMSKDRGASYTITIDALRYLGVDHVENLPQYAEFSAEIEKRVIPQNTENN